MDKTKSEQFVDKQICSRFPKWGPTSKQLEDWQWQLEPFNEQVALNAVRQHVTKNRFNSPILKDVLELCRLEQQSLCPQKKVKDVPDSGVYVQCVESGQMKAGFFMPIITKPLLKFGVDVGLRDVAENMRQRMEELYKGRWITYTGTTSAQMFKKRRLLQNERKTVSA